MPPPGQVTAGASLGTAYARIVFDSSDLSRAPAAARSAGQQVANEINRITAASQNANRGLESTLSVLTRLAGIGTGIGAAYKLGQLALDADSIATAYNRQHVAAVSLAGSQEKLNELLSTYDRVTGGAIDKATALSDVTRLQAIGFADTTDELEQFVTAARGISVAMGSNQDYVISQLTLAIANQSTKRLDQIGLGVTEVEKRIEDLKRADGSLTQEQAYQNAVLGIAIEKYGKLAKSAEAQATGAEKAEKAWKDLKLQLGETLGGPTGGVLTGLSNELIGISGYLKGVTDDAHSAQKALDDMRKAQPGTAAHTFGQVGGAVESFFTTDPRQWLKDAVAQLYGPQGQIRGLENQRSSLLAGRDTILAGIGNGTSTQADLQRQDALLKQVNDQLAIFQSQLRLTSTLPNLAAVMPGFGKAPYHSDATGPGGYTEQQTALIVEHQRALDRIASDAAQARQEATASYEQQRTETIRQYEQTIAREAQDYGRQRQRAEEQLQKQLTDITAEQKSREAQYAIDLADSIAKITDDGNKRIGELEHDYQKSRERDLEQHNDRMFDAIGNLDAKALAEENRRFARSSKNAEDDFSDRIAKEKEQINQRVQDEIDANEKRIQEGRKADLQRSLDLQAAFDDQRKQEDEDRQIRLTRMAEDHQAQLDQMDIAQGQRLQQIDDHAAQERTALDDEFVKQLEQLGIHNDAWTRAQADYQDKSLELYKEWWKARLELDNKALAELVKVRPNDPLFGPPSPGQPHNSFFPGFADGGPVMRDQLAWVHAGEYVLSKSMLDHMGGSTGPQAWGGGNKTLTLSDGAIQIHATGGQSALDIAGQVRAEIVSLFEGL